MRYSRVLAALAALVSCSGVVSLAPVAHRLTGALAPLTKPVAEALSPVWAGDYDKAAVRSSIKRETAEHSVVIYTMDFSLGLGSALQLLEEHERGVKVVFLAFVACAAAWAPRAPLRPGVALAAMKKEAMKRNDRPKGEGRVRQGKRSELMRGLIDAPIVPTSEAGTVSEDDPLLPFVKREPCPICLEQRPLKENSFLSCCSKLICTTCGWKYAAYQQATTGEVRCPLCRHVVPFDDAETIDLMRKNVERGDTAAMTQLGLYYRDGKMGLRVDLSRAASYYERAAALGHLGAMVDLGIACEGGRGVPRDAAAAAGGTARRPTAATRARR
ncbi:hypothetical protein JL722_10103 [Aureococcus anophagefferens]|nr:hypothetical protein JL722_10103 [Aureococcus anophagefferens]